MEEMLICDSRFSSTIDYKTVVFLDADVKFGEGQTKIVFVGFVRSKWGNELLI